MIIWGIGLPLLAFMKLYKHNQNNKLYKPKNKKVYGFLFLGYLRKKYWWELVILARKTFILTNVLLMNQISSAV